MYVHIYIIWHELYPIYLLHSPINPTVKSLRSVILVVPHEKPPFLRTLQVDTMMEAGLRVMVMIGWRDVDLNPNHG